MIRNECNKINSEYFGTYATCTLVLVYLKEKLYSEIEIKFGKEFAIFIKEKWKQFLDDFQTIVLCFGKKAKTV